MDTAEKLEKASELIQLAKHLDAFIDLSEELDLGETSWKQGIQVNMFDRGYLSDIFLNMLELRFPIRLIPRQPGKQEKEVDFGHLVNMSHKTALQDYEFVNFILNTGDVVRRIKALAIELALATDADMCCLTAKKLEMGQVDTGILLRLQVRAENLLQRSSDPEYQFRNLDSVLDSMFDEGPLPLLVSDSKWLWQQCFQWIKGNGCLLAVAFLKGEGHRKDDDDWWGAIDRIVDRLARLNDILAVACEARGIDSSLIYRHALECDTIKYDSNSDCYVNAFVTILRLTAKLSAEMETASARTGKQSQLQRPSLNESEENILEALGTNVLTGEKLAKKSGYPFNSNFKKTLSGLRKRDILDNKAPGYCLSSAYYHLLDNSDKGQGKGQD